MTENVLRRPTVRALPWALALAAVVAVPFVGSRLQMFLFMEIMIFGVAATSLNLLVGYGRMVSFGHAAFFGLGVYAAGISLQRFTGLGVFGAIVIAVGTAVVFAAVVGIFCVRRGSIYFAMLTLAFAQLIMLLVVRMRGLTGGEQGLTGGIPRPAMGPWDPGTADGLYWLVVVVTVLAMVGMWWFLESPFGLSLRALAVNEERARANGINVTLYQWITFVVAGGFGAVAGALHAMFQSAAFPENLHWTTSAVIIIIGLLGGIENFSGPMVGAAAFVYLQRYAGALFEAEALVLGILLVFVVLVMRGGIVGGVLKAGEWALGGRRASFASRSPSRGSLEPTGRTPGDAEQGD